MPTDWKSEAKPVSSWKQEAAPAEPETGTLETLKQAAAQGLTMGWGDEIVAAGYAAALGALEGGNYEELYDEYVADLRADAKKAAQDNPKLYQATEFVSSLATPGGAAGKGVKGIAKAGLSGAVEGFGRGEGLEESAKQAGYGAGGAALFKGVADKAGSKLSSKGEKLTRQAAESSGVDKLGTKVSVAGKRKAGEVLRELAPDLPKKASAEELVTTLSDKRKQVGDAIGQLTSKLDDAGATPPSMQLVTDVPDRLRKQFVVEGKTAEAANRVKSLIDSTYQQFGESFQGTQAMKRSLSSVAKEFPAGSESRRYVTAVQSKVNDIMKEAAGKAQQGLGDEWRTLDKTYEGLGTLVKGLDKAIAQPQTLGAKVKDVAKGAGEFAFGGPYGRISGVKRAIGTILASEPQVDLAAARKANKLLKKYAEEGEKVLKPLKGKGKVKQLLNKVIEQSPTNKEYRGRVMTKTGAQLGTEEE